MGAGRYCGRCGRRFSGGGGRAWLLFPALLAGVLAAGFTYRMVRSASHERETWEFDQTERVLPSPVGRFEIFDGMTHVLPNGAKVTLRLDRRSRRFLIEHNGRIERLTRMTRIESPHEYGETLTLVKIGESVSEANAWFTLERADGED